jgi:hypothetical protein
VDFANPESPKGSRYLGPDSSNPYAASEAASEPSLKPLGSLARSAQLKQLNTARLILFFLGVVFIGVHAYEMANLETLVEEQIQKEIAELGPGMVADPTEVAKFRENMLNIARILDAGLIGLGVLFIVFGLIIKKYPVPVTVLSLVLYIGVTAALALLNSMTLFQGIILKVIIVVCLVKAMQAAFAYQKEVNEARLAGDLA